MLSKFNVMSELGICLYISKLTPSNTTWIGLVHFIVPSIVFVCLLRFSNLSDSNTFLLCLEDVHVISILFTPSIQVESQPVLSIPAVQPILYLPTVWNSFGIVICIQISGFDCIFGIKRFVKNSHFLWSLINPPGVSPHLWGKILTSYLSNSIIDLTISLERAPYPLYVSIGQLIIKLGLFINI